MKLDEKLDEMATNYEYMKSEIAIMTKERDQFIGEKYVLL